MIRIATLLLLVTSFASGQDPNVSMTNTPQEIGVGESCVVSFEFTHDSVVNADGFQFSVCHDPAIVEVVGVELSPGIDSIYGGGGPAFESLETSAEGWSASVILSITGLTDLAAGTYSGIHATYQALGPIGESAALENCEIGPIGFLGGVLFVQDLVFADTDYSLVVGPPGTRFRRGDFNQDGGVDVADPIAIGAYLFADGPGSGCLQSGDTNADGAIDIADMVAALTFLFVGTTLPPPFPDCGVDPISPLTCVNYAACP